MSANSPTTIVYVPIIGQEDKESKDCYISIIGQESKESKEHYTRL